jgi:hypothetical protein
MRGKILTTWRFIGDVKRWLGRFKKGGKQDRKKGRLQINNGRSNVGVKASPVQIVRERPPWAPVPAPVLVLASFSEKSSCNQFRKHENFC